MTFETNDNYSIRFDLNWKNHYSHSTNQMWDLLYLYLYLCVLQSAQSRVLIKGGRVVNEDHSFVADVYVEDGVVKFVSSSSSSYLFPINTTMSIIK